MTKVVPRPTSLVKKNLPACFSTIVACASGTYEVLKRVDGRTSGESDAEQKCNKVSGYTKWYFYDSELDSLDFVLCLREYGSD